MRNLHKISILSTFLAAILLVIPAQFTLADLNGGQVSQATPEEKSELERQLQAIQQEIAQYERELSGVQSEKNTLNNKIKQLQTQKNKISAQIRETNLNIQNISEQLDTTEQEISLRQEHLVSLREEIANIIPAIYEKDQQSLVEMLLVNDGILGFYNELDAYEQINKNLKNYLDQIEEESIALKREQDQLNDQQESQKEFLSIQSVQNQQLASNIGDQNDLLQQTKGVEATYQASLKDRRAAAAKIQSRLYELFGVGPGQQVNFGQAVEIAKYASAQTGVRAAFLLAILTQESSLGKNVGTCNRAGDPPNKSYKVVMKPDRDIKPFLQVTADLGMDPETTPVSCPMFTKGKQVGWGGAMGPAQFIPSTWMGYKDKIAAVTGKPANPWDIRDAFLATAIKTKADGAGTVAGEWAAAMKYFSGGTNVKFRFYGDNVVATANRYQADIDALNVN